MGGRLLGGGTTGTVSNPGAINQVGGSKPNLSAREMARLKWASSSSLTTSSSSTASSSEHQTFNERTSSSSSSVEVTKSSLGKREHDSELADCPVCGKKVPQSDMNQHLDTCLQNQEKSDGMRKMEGKGRENDDMFGDSDDDMLMEAADAAEKSVISIPSDDDDDDLPLVEVEESDDDHEPIIKRRIMDHSLEQVGS